MAEIREKQVEWLLQNVRDFLFSRVKQHLTDDEYRELRKRLSVELAEQDG